MTKQELIDQVAVHANNVEKRTVEKIVDALFFEVGCELQKNGRVGYPGFGTFTVKERAERPGRNPQTGEAITIAASKTVGFKAAPALKGRL